MSSEETLLQVVPKIDFSGLDLTQSGTHGWDVVRAQVMEGLDRFGCFEAVYDELRQELREAVLDGAAKELFGLPLETKMKCRSDIPYRGYIGQIPGIPYENLGFEDAHHPLPTQDFTTLMWPAGNPRFSDPVRSLATQLVELDQMVQKMILESLGTEKYYNSHIESTKYLLRLAEYGAPQSQKAEVRLREHKDNSLLTLLCQDQVHGFELLTKNGDWIQIKPSPNSVIVMTGYVFEAWSNGRLSAPLHRVMLSGNLMRHSCIHSSIPKDDHIIQAPEELVDEEHPSLFKPYYYVDSVRFGATQAGYAAENILKAFCGITKQGVEA